MLWEFTPEQVVKGEVDYKLEDFRRDLREEVAGNLGGDEVDEELLQRSFDVIYDLCYWEATGKEFDDFIATLEEDAPLQEPVLRGIREHMRDNITMLGAILQRMIMDGVEQGLPVEQAIEQAARRHAADIATASH